jgi:hypothetical protein
LGASELVSIGSSGGSSSVVRFMGEWGWGAATLSWYVWWVSLTGVMLWGRHVSMSKGVSVSWELEGVVEGRRPGRGLECVLSEGGGRFACGLCVFSNPGQW